MGRDFCIDADIRVCILLPKSVTEIYW